MLPAFLNVTTQINSKDHDIDLDDLKSSVLSSKLVMLKWIQTTKRQLKDEIKRTKNIILTESKKEINYVDEILKEKLKIVSTIEQEQQRKLPKNETKTKCSFQTSDHSDEHISHNQNQQFFKRCSAKLTNNEQCSKSVVNLVDGEDKEKIDLCQKHLKSIKKRENGEKDDKKETKVKRKYVKSNGSTNKNENKPRKSRKKKDQNSTSTDELANDDMLNINQSNNHMLNRTALSISMSNGMMNGAKTNQPFDSNHLIDRNLTPTTNSTAMKTFDTITSNSNFKSQQMFSPFNGLTLPNNLCYSNLTDNNSTGTGPNGHYDGYGSTAITTDHTLIENHHYAPCITNNLNSNNGDNLSNNLNQLSNLNHSEDSLVAIVNNSDDIPNVPFEESELSEMLGKIGKIPEDAFNDLFMDNLSTESSELRAIDNIVFNCTDNLDNLEPSISNQTFSSLNFKNNSSTFFSHLPVDQHQNAGLIYSNGHDLNNLANVNGNLNGNMNIICLPNDHNNFDNNINGNGGLCGPQLSNNNQPNDSNNYSSYNTVLDFKQSSYSSNVVHANYNDGTTNNFNSNYLNHQTDLSNGYSSTINGNEHLLNNGNQILSNGHSNNSLNGNVYNNGPLPSNGISPNLTSNNVSTPNNNQSYLDCSTPSSNASNNKTEDKKFNLFSNRSTNYSNKYSNIYDDLPSFESNRVNGNTPSLPSFSLVLKKNHVESR